MNQRAMPVFYRPLDVHTVPDGGLETSVEATAEERAAIAYAIDIPSIGALTATYTIGKRVGGRIKIDGAVKARITQICVVSLDPFDSEVEAPVDTMFAPVEQAERSPGGVRTSRRRVHPNEPRQAAPVEQKDENGDPLDPIIDGRIDLGAVAVEFLTLVLDFYPRKPGAQFSDVVTGDPRANPSAFAALERLKDRS